MALWQIYKDIEQPQEKQTVEVMQSEAKLLKSCKILLEIIRLFLSFIWVFRKEYSKVFLAGEISEWHRQTLVISPILYHYFILAWQYVIICQFITNQKLL